MLLATCFISALPWTWNNNGTDVEEISMGTMCDKATLCGFTCDEMDNVVMARRCAWTDNVVSLLHGVRIRLRSAVDMLAGMPFGMLLAKLTGQPTRRRSLWHGL